MPNKPLAADGARGDVNIADRQIGEVSEGVGERIGNLGSSKRPLLL